jgi:hypothetical protein
MVAAPLQLRVLPHAHCVDACCTLLAAQRQHRAAARAETCVLSLIPVRTWRWLRTRGWKKTRLVGANNAVVVARVVSSVESAWGVALRRGRDGEDDVLHRYHPGQPLHRRQIWNG